VIVDTIYPVWSIGVYPYINIYNQFLGLIANNYTLVDCRIADKLCRSKR